MKTLLALLLALVLVACATKRDELEQAENQCIARGVTPDNPKFNDCLVDANLKNQQEMDDEMNSMALQDDALMSCCW